MKATLRFSSKLTLLNGETSDVAIAELKVWDVPKSDHYPEGLKYRLFLVAKESGLVIVGFDNHKPKGPHLHYRGEERDYTFRGVERLIEDFWRWVEREGFLI
jgi:hypothetical protein